MLPGVDIAALIESSLGLLFLEIIIFAESGLLIGFFLPGDSLLFTAGFLVASGHLHVNIVFLIVLTFIAAVLGDTVGYVFGRRVGRKLFNRENSRLFRQENLQRAEAFYEKYGSRTIILARFIPIIRTFAPIVAGTSAMRYRTFIAFNLIGAALWTTGVTLIGYFLGHILGAVFKIDDILLPLIFIIIIISILPPLIHMLRTKQQRKAFWEGTKRELSLIFSRKKK